MQPYSLLLFQIIPLHFRTWLQNYCNHLNNRTNRNYENSVSITYDIKRLDRKHIFWIWWGRQVGSTLNHSDLVISGIHVWGCQVVKSISPKMSPEIIILLYYLSNESCLIWLCAIWCIMMFWAHKFICIALYRDEKYKFQYSTFGMDPLITTEIICWISLADLNLS